MDLFDYMKKEALKDNAPLASRMRPRNLSEIVGQKQILGEGKMLRRIIEADRLSSIILYGPPGTGKTTIAKVIAGTTSCLFSQINATTSGKKDMEAIIKDAEHNLGLYQKKTILFIDEIHRFNKSQQDYLLPFVEDGRIILIGATTENPYFEVNQALLSRSDIYRLELLQEEELVELLKVAVLDTERGLGNEGLKVEEEAYHYIAKVAAGDARRALNALEIAALSSQNHHITLEVAKESIQKKVASYDKSGDNHYDTISAFIKSMRGSDPDAALIYLGKMLDAGEDIKFIARRIMILAAEDIGMADPFALVLATSCSQAIERIGLPEASIILAEAVVYMSTAPKSNSSYLGILNARARLKEDPCLVPAHLRDGHYSGASQLGNALGYLYPHDYPNHYVSQTYLPESLLNEKFYEPSQEGYEKKIRTFLEKLKGE